MRRIVAIWLVDASNLCPGVNYYILFLVEMVPVVLIRVAVTPHLRLLTVSHPRSTGTSFDIAFSRCLFCPRLPDPIKSSLRRRNPNYHTQSTHLSSSLLSYHTDPIASSIYYRHGGFSSEQKGPSRFHLATLTHPTHACLFPSTKFDKTTSTH